MQNYFEGRGVVYLTFQWLDVENQIIFDQKDTTTKAIFDFIENAIKKYESVLVHSVRGQSRSSSVLAAYFMRKYRWSMLKTLEFLNSRRPDLEIRGTFIQQLQQFEQRLSTRGLGPLSFNFNELSFKGKGFPRELQEEEMIIRNTFLNAQMGQIVQYGNMGSLKRDKAIKWVDKKHSSTDQKQPLTTLIPAKQSFSFKSQLNHHERIAGDVPSCLRTNR